jgi:hypothetical protein
MKKQLFGWILVLFVLVCAPFVSAEDFALTGKNITLDVSVVSEGMFYDADHINISIYEPVTRVQAVYSQLMTKLSTGQYYYNFVPNKTGVYYYVFNIYNSTAKIYESSDTFTVQESPMIPVDITAYVIGFSAVIFALFYVSFKLDQQNVFMKTIFSIFGVIMMFSLVAFVSDNSNNCVLDTSSGAVVKLCSSTYDVNSLYIWMFGILLFLVLGYAFYVAFIKNIFEKVKTKGLIR